jgi:hypothetical protein
MMVMTPTDTGVHSGGGAPIYTHGRDSITLSEAAALLERNPTTLRRYVKAGKLKATRAPGKYGEEYRIKPTVLKVFALETFSIVLEDADLDAALSTAEGVRTLSKSSPLGAPVSEQERDLWERLLTATEEATRYKAICETSENTYKAQIAALEAENAALRARRRWFRRKSRPDTTV